MTAYAEADRHYAATMARMPWAIIDKRNEIVARAWTRYAADSAVGPSGIYARRGWRSVPVPTIRYGSD